MRRLLQTVAEWDGAAIVQRDYEEEGPIGTLQALVIDVEDPLLSSRIPPESSIRCSGIDGFVDRARSCAIEDLVQKEFRDYPWSSY